MTGSFIMTLIRTTHALYSKKAIVKPEIFTHNLVVLFIFLLELIEKTFIGIVTCHQLFLYCLLKENELSDRSHKNAKLTKISNKEIVRQENESGSGFEVILEMYSVQLSHVPSHFFLYVFPVMQFAFLSSHGLV